MTWLGTLFTMLGLAVGYFVYRRGMDRAGLVGGYRLLGLWAIPFAAVGAKLAELIAEGHLSWDFFNLFAGGRSLVAGIIGGWIGVVIGKRRMGLTTPTGQFWAPALALGEAIGRIGCFFNGCCFGTRTDVAWALEGRHPSQLYSAVAAFSIYLLLLRMPNRWPAYLLLYGVTRFAIEFFRQPVSTPIAGLSIVQWCCILAIGAGIYGLRAQPTVVSMETA